MVTPSDFIGPTRGSPTRRIESSAQQEARRVNEEAEAYRRLAEEVRQAQEAYDTLIGPPSPSTEELEYEPYRQLAEEARRAREEVEALNKSMDESGRSSNRASGGIGNMGVSSFRAALGLGFLGFTIGGVLGYIAGVVKSTGEGSLAFLEFGDSARELARNLSDLLNIPEGISHATDSVYSLAEAVAALDRGEPLEVLRNLALGVATPIFGANAPLIERILGHQAVPYQAPTPPTQYPGQGPTSSATYQAPAPTVSVVNFNAPVYGDAAVRDVARQELSRRANGPYFIGTPV